MSNIVIDIAAEFSGAKSFKQAETSTDKLTKSVKKLAKTLGVAYSAQQVLAYGKASIKAAAADQKAQQQLALALKNVGLGRDAASSESYIQALQSEFGIVDDKLRPAYQTLAIATRDTAEAQKLLNLSLDISASTGKDLSTVTAALSKAYLGNNTALSKLGIGISKADLKSKSFDEITKQLSTTFAGSATQAANSYQGSLDKLGVAATNVSEIIGTGLIDALSGLGKDHTINDFAKSMEDAALYVADVIRGVGILAKKIGDIPILGDALKFLFTSAPAFDYLAKLGKQSRIAAGQNTDNANALADLARLESAYKTKTLNTTKKITKETAKQLADARLKNAIDKANAALAKGDDIFNMDKIQIAAALANQAEQLGKATTASQVLQIANDTARLKVKQDILALEDAIAAGDAASIEAATKKLNEDMKILGALQGQSVKLMDIKSLLESLKPKDLINIANLEEALRLLGLINLAATGSKSTPSGYSGGTGTVANQYPNNTGYPNYGMQQASSIAATNLNTELLGGVVSVIGDNLKEYLTPSGGMLSGISPSGREFNFTVNVNTGIGDPNAIAEAVNSVIQDAVDRGTLRGGSY